MAVGAVMLCLAIGLVQPADVDSRLAAAKALTEGGQPVEALNRYLAILPSVADPSRRADVLLAIGLLENTLGKYADALGHASEAADALGRLQDSIRQAEALNIAGLSQLYAGDYRGALAHLQRAVALSVTSGAPAGHAEQLSNLGNVFFFLGRYGEAERAYADAQALTDRHDSEPWAARRRRILRLNEAVLAQRLGDYQAALAVYRAEVSAGTLRPDEHAQSLVNQGALFRRLGDPWKAIEAYRGAEALLSRARHTDAELQAVINRGIVLALDLGALTPAGDAFSEALRRAIAIGSQRGALHARLYRAEVALRVGDLDLARVGFEASLAAADALQTPEEQWKALYGLGRVARRTGRHDEASQYLERAVAVIEGIREQLRVPSTRVDFFQDKREVYDELLAARLHTASAERMFTLMERSRARAWRDRLKLSSNVDLQAVQRQLAPGTILLSYWHSGPGSALVRVSRDEVSLSPLMVEEPRVRDLIRRLAEPGTDWRASAEAIASSLLPPGTIGSDATHIVVIPDGLLAAVPFETLIVDGQPLLAHAAISYLPTASLLARGWPEPPRLAPPWTTILTAHGDPRVDSGAAADEALPPLPASADEIVAVAAEIGGATRVLLGLENQKVQLVDPTEPRSPLLHIATHAAVHSAIERSRLIFSSRVAGGPAEELYLREIYDLALSGVDLVVLSACDTEQGPMLGGEGVQSFSRGLLAAGAGSTVTTLWKVPDTVPVALMPVFYDGLQRGQRRDDALRRAKLALMSSGDARSHPYFWAPYVLTGASGPVPRAWTWSRLLAASIALCAGGVVMIALVRARQRSACPT